MIAMKKYLFPCCAVLVLLTLTGCLTPIGADKVSSRQAYENLHENALNSSHCSADTLRVLHRYGLDESYQKDPDATLEKLQAIACTDDRRDLLRFELRGEPAQHVDLAVTRNELRHPQHIQPINCAARWP